MRASCSQSLRSTAALVFAVFLAGNSLWCQQSTQSSAGPTRTEKDLLGEKQVPANAYYGVQTLRALENLRKARSGAGELRRWRNEEGEVGRNREGA